MPGGEDVEQELELGISKESKGKYFDRQMRRQPSLSQVIRLKSRLDGLMVVEQRIHASGACFFFGFWVW